MPYVNKPRPYKKEYTQQKSRDEQPSRNARARARYDMDKRGVVMWNKVMRLLGQPTLA